MDLDTFQPALITSIKTDAKANHGNRLHEQYMFIQELIEKYPPELVYIEKGFSKFAAATQALFKMVGVANLALKDYEEKYFAPTSVKKVITGNGKASKIQVKNAILKKYPDIEFSNEDESDAMAVVLTGLIKDNLLEWEI